MSANTITVLIGWLIALAIFFGFVVLLRYLAHRERMALITHGINPESLQKRHRSKGVLRAGLITMMVGFTLTIGLYPLGFLPLLPAAFTTAPFHLGPWLLPGLIPFGVGLALTTSYYLEQASPPAPPEESKPAEKVIPIKNHLDKERREQQ